MKQGAHLNQRGPLIVSGESRGGQLGKRQRGHIWKVDSAEKPYYGSRGNAVKISRCVFDGHGIERCPCRIGFSVCAANC
jgi:hypothetical protein